MRRTPRISLKTLLIPVMAVFLVYRITALTSLSELQAVTVVNELQKNTVPKSGPEPSRPEPDWPSRSLNDVLKHDPFAVSAAEQGNKPEQNSPAEDEKGIPSLPPLKLKAVYHSRHGAVALVGSEIVRAGERLSDGSLVLSIGENSIVVQRSGAAPHTEVNTLSQLPRRGIQ